MRRKQGIVDGIDEVKAKVKRREDRVRQLRVQNEALDSELRAVRLALHEAEEVEQAEAQRESELCVRFVHAKLANEVATREERAAKGDLKEARQACAEQDKLLLLQRNNTSDTEATASYERSRAEEEESALAQLHEQIAEQEAELKSARTSLTLRQEKLQTEEVELESLTQQMSLVCAKVSSALEGLRRL